MHVLKHLLSKCWGALIVAVCSFVVTIVIGQAWNREITWPLLVLGIVWAIVLSIRGFSVYLKMIASALGEAFESHSSVPNRFLMFAVKHPIRDQCTGAQLARAWMRESRQNGMEAIAWFQQRPRSQGKASIKSST